MKVLIINTHDIKGGAAKAAYRLHQALNESGASSKMLVRSKDSMDPSVIALDDIYKGRAAFFDALPSYNYQKVEHQLFSSAMVTNPILLDFINESDADIVHIHWIALGFLSLEDVFQINKAVVFSLHDMWLFTGGCHYSQDCQLYQNSCQRCPSLKSLDDNDLSSINFVRKLQLFNSRPDVTIIGLSQWIAQEATKSAILHNSNIKQLPNPVNTDVFRPVDKILARQTLGLSLEKPIILFAADGGTRDPRKGYHYLNAILSGTLATRQLHVVTFGNRNTQKIEKGLHTLEHLPTIDAEEQIVLLLNAADVVVLPSIQENLSNLVLESLSCGTPVVAFDIGGNSDMIRHLDNGYLASFADSQDLAEGIRWGLSHKFNPEAIRQRILENFSYDVVAAKYMTLYRSLNYETQLYTDTTFPNLLKATNNSQFEWTTAQLENWIIDLCLLKQPFFIYGFGILGRYLQLKLAKYCVAVIDQNFTRYKTQNSTIEFYGIDYLNELSNALILVSIYDPDCTIRSSIENRVKSNCKVLSLFESFTVQEK
jgi:glycosyltransferase involved in cell wall biosynthesis